MGSGSRRSVFFPLLLAALCALPVSVLAQGATGGPAPSGFLTGPAEGTPREIALRYLASHLEELGLTSADLADLVVQDEYLSRHNGVTHLYFRQRLDGVEVVNGDINVNVMSDGRILNLGNGFVGDLASQVNSRSPALSQETAIQASAEHLGLTLAGPPIVLETIGGPAMEALFDGANLSREAIPIELMYLPLEDDRVRLVWSLVVQRFETPDWWNLFVDAASGEVLAKFNWTADIGVELGESGRLASAPRAGSPADAEGVCPLSDCYNVFALPKESPLDGPRTQEVMPWDLTASPFGWHDTNGAPGAEFNDSRGNNVEAQTDLNGNNTFGGADIRADGGPNRDFDFPFDPNLGPDTYRPFAVTNLFYWNNIIHDVSYLYGFDEASGNFQTNNYGRGGIGGDPVQADAQDNSEPPSGAPSCNNANFGTPPDGSDPRMQMFVWTGVPNARLTVNTAPIAGDYDAAKGCWGGPLSPPTTADVELVNDGSSLPSQGCGALIGFTPGNIALIDRGTCEFGVKARNAQNAGASGAVIVNNQQLPNGLIAMGAGAQGGSVTIPTVMIGNADGTTIRNELPGVNATIQPPLPGGNIDRDSDLDNGVINHEYGHGISNRLVGGPGNVGCLQNQEQMGEGWSDWWTLVLSAVPSDTGPMGRGIGTYVSFQPENGPGIRPYPYSTDMGVNPLTYGWVANGGTVSIPHGWGTIWNTMLWEMYWLLVDRYGFDTDFYGGVGGNNVAMRLVVDGLKMTSCSPSMVAGRDGILAADTATYGGFHQCEIWQAFAKRGVGMSASAGSAGVVGDEVEAFDVPTQYVNCLPVFADGFNLGDTGRWSATVPPIP